MVQGRFAFVMGMPWGSAMAQAWVATASVAITSMSFFYIETPPEWAALQKLPPGAMESRGLEEELLSSDPIGQSVIPSEVVNGKHL